MRVPGPGLPLPIEAGGKPGLERIDYQRAPGAIQPRRRPSNPENLMIQRISFLLVSCLLSTAVSGLTPSELWRVWPDARFTQTAAPCLRHAELMESLEQLVARYSGDIELETVGESFQGRSIRMMTIGDGDRKVLLWSQMHGNEPSATPALLDMAHYLLSHADEPGPRAILENLTLLMIPMLNPDGTELYVRRNVQAIDINRDALNLTTLEGQALKAVRDRHEPLLGFNLHDQNRRKAVGDSGVLATNAVLAVAGDREGTITPGRLRAKRACSAIVEALAPFMPGGMARYEEDWSPRAFGDNITAWGTPVVLIESGGLPVGHPFTDLTRLNFVALLTVLEDLAVDDLAQYDPEIYEELPRNRNNAWADVVVREGYLLQPGTSVAYRADLSFVRFQDDRELAGCAVETSNGSSIFEIGDNRFIGAGHEIDAEDSVLLAPFVVGVRGWSARKWLDGDALADLASLGVGTVRWSVPARKQIAARELVGRWKDEGRARVEVVAGSATLPPSVLEGPPLVTSRSLGEILQTLGSAGSLHDLWLVGSATGDGLPALRPGQPASFLLVSPAPNGEIDLQETALTSVWFDGVEIQSTPQWEAP